MGEKDNPVNMLGKKKIHPCFHWHVIFTKFSFIMDKIRED